MEIKEVRRRNLKRLQTEFRTLAAIGRVTGVSVAYLSHILSEVKHPSGSTRGMGDRLARRLELGCGKPRGWMDTDHDEPKDRERRYAARPGWVRDQPAPDLEAVHRAFRDGSIAKRQALALLGALPESEVTAVLMLLQSLSAKYDRPAN